MRRLYAWVKRVCRIERIPARSWPPTPDMALRARLRSIESIQAEERARG